MVVWSVGPRERGANSLAGPGCRGHAAAPGCQGAGANATAAGVDSDARTVGLRNDLDPLTGPQPGPVMAVRKRKIVKFKLRFS